MCLLFAIRVLLSRENKRRDAEPVDDTYDNVFPHEDRPGWKASGNEGFQGLRLFFSGSIAC
jgi:hypothetical protein